jgi:lipopolysaccharide/colanic/teichoic acid biosynthesis glycosyltransferase
VKRLLDTFTSLVLLILLSPLIALIGILIKLETSGPMFFTQQRVGLNGQLFSICKFRSMYVGSEIQGSHSTSENDPRITRVGRFIRATSLDELPQLVNVLKGEMSIVGPRPDLMIQKADYSPEDWNLRISVRPGITGLAQVNGRSNCTFEERLNYDLEYTRSHDILLDLKILFKTAEVVLFRKNIN